MLIDENQLDQWMRGHAEQAQGLTVELVWRLVAASSPSPRDRRFPLGDSTGQPGPDGRLDTEIADEPYVPEGMSHWEIGSGVKAGKKATSDYRDAVADTPAEVRKKTTFIFVTPLSGRRDWPDTWKEGSQSKWKKVRNDKKEWNEVRVIDGTRLVEWLRRYPAVEQWLVQKIDGITEIDIESIQEHWGVIKSIGKPPSLTPRLFVASRNDERAKLNEIFSGATARLRITTRFPDQVVDFIAAHVAELPAEQRADIEGRCLIIHSESGWNVAAKLNTRHVLIASDRLDLSDTNGTKLIQKASNRGHAIVFGGLPGGEPDPASIPLRSPKADQMIAALVEAGHSQRRAQTVAQRSNGALGSLLRCLQNLSVHPAWARAGEAEDAEIALLIGAWDEQFQADKTVAGIVAGNSYGEWIAKMRSISLQPSAPLTLIDGRWKFVPRYEGWYALGPRLFDEHLTRFSEIVSVVLGEVDPRFELPSDERYAAALYGKKLKHSEGLRRGIAEGLALLGSHPGALSSCSSNAPDRTAVLAVRSLLNGANGLLWASLNELLPLLAEASPGEFLSQVEAALEQEPSPFDEIFAQESGGLFGGTYLSGLLWALETLAWAPSTLNRAVLCLGELAARDPGGAWSNRPEASLTAIFLPWFPQTCATIDEREVAMRVLLRDCPVIAWKVLLTLLPKHLGATSGTRKPVWRDMIPEDWREGVTRRENYEQVNRYSKISMDEIKKDPKKMKEFVDYYDAISTEARIDFLNYLNSDEIRAASEEFKQPIWAELLRFSSHHRKYASAEWALSAQEIEKLETCAASLSPLSPSLKFRRLFEDRDFDLYSGVGSYDEQACELNGRRERAVSLLEEEGGPDAILKLATDVQSPIRLGGAYGAIASNSADTVILPAMFEHSNNAISQFLIGYVWSRFRKLSWEWVDNLDLKTWNKEWAARFLISLPFTDKAWERVESILGVDKNLYWENTTANPYDAEESLSVGIKELIDHGRPMAALHAIWKLLHDKYSIDAELVVQALMSGLTTRDSTTGGDAHYITTAISFVQKSSVEDKVKLQIEFGYLPLLQGSKEVSPSTLYQKMAQTPSMFCEAIRMVFKSKKPEYVEDIVENKEAIAKNAYRLIDDWNVSPGTQPDGSFVGRELVKWVAEVERECEDSGHLDVARTLVGQVLAHVPADPTGLWIDRSAAAILDAKSAKQMRSGFSTKIHNLRGAHWVDPTGAPEIALANKYKNYAEALERQGFSRFAASVKAISDSYFRQAEGIIRDIDTD